MEEFKKISPAFVVCTGDLVNAGDGRTISVDQAEQWFGAYRTSMSSLTMPVYNGPGNHDMANLSCEWAVDAQQGCSTNAWRDSFGPGYYSFDWGWHHCIVLDPAAVSAGSFQSRGTVKVSTSAVLTIEDLQSHLPVYQGHCVTIQGTTDQAMFYPDIGLPAGSGGARFDDGAGRVLIYAAECYTLALPEVNLGDTIRVKVIPMRFTWGFITSSLDREGTFGMMKMQDGMLPDARQEAAGGPGEARWFLRVVTAADIEVL